jgi:hypothetical protein
MHASAILPQFFFWPKVFLHVWVPVHPQNAGYSASEMATLHQ